MNRKEEKKKKSYTYTRRASDGMFLGTNLRPRFEQSTVYPLQSHSIGHESKSSSTSSSSNEAVILRSRAETRHIIRAETVNICILVIGLQMRFAMKKTLKGASSS